MANEKRIYKNYYVTNRKFVDLSNAVPLENVERLTYTDEIQCWPKTLYNGEKAVELKIGKVAPECGRKIAFDLGCADFSGRNVLTVAVNGATPCMFVTVTLAGTDGRRADYTVNFFNDRWSKLLVDVSDCGFLESVCRIELSFYGKKDAWSPENEVLYLGELGFGNALDFQFERADSTAYFQPQSCVKQGDGCMIWSFGKGEGLLFPAFENARYSVLNSVIYIKDCIKISARVVSGCRKFRLYVATDRNNFFTIKRSAVVRFGGEGIVTRLVKIDGFAVDKQERLCGIKLLPLEKEGEIELYDVSPVQEKDFLLNDRAREYLTRKPVTVRNPYKFEVPQTVYNARDYGAKGNFYDNDTPAIQAAIDDATAHGGGIVLLEKGRFVASHIRLASNIEFRIARDAILIQSERPQDYPYPVAYEHDNINYDIQWAHNFLVHNKPLLYADGLENVRVCGGGKIRMADTGSEALMGGWPYYDIHCNALIHIVPLSFSDCRNVEFSNLTINRVNSYHVRLQRCENVFVNRVKLFDARCLSADGIGLACSKNVLVANVMYCSNDDGVTLVSSYDDPRGRNPDGYWHTAPGKDNSALNIEVRNSYINSGYGGWGKAIAFIPWGRSAPNQEYAQVKGIYVHDCILDGGHSVGTWCDDPYHGKQPYDGTELDDHTCVSDVVLRNNEYLSKCDLLAVEVTNMVSDNGLKSVDHIVNGDFRDRLCHWKYSEGVAYDLEAKRVPLAAGQKLYQIISSTEGRNEFGFTLKGSGELFIEGKRVAFSLENGGTATISALFRNVRNIKVGVIANTDVEIYGAFKK